MTFKCKPEYHRYLALYGNSAFDIYVCEYSCHKIQYASRLHYFEIVHSISMCVIFMPHNYEYVDQEKGYIFYLNEIT